MYINRYRLMARVAWRRNERGATATEYGLLVSFIAIAILIGVAAFGGALNTVFQGFAGVVSSGF